MVLKKLTPNAHVLDDGVTRILFSYETPVAAEIGAVFYYTEKKWSNTTSKCIAEFKADIDPDTAESKPQDFFDQLEIFER